MQEAINNCLSISVIMPVYNVAPYVERCLRSVMRQTYPATECIIVDDASPDDSIARCKRLIGEYIGPTHFRILHHDHNRGISATRNTGTDAATSTYIFYVDSDDEMAVDCLEKLVKPIYRDESLEMVMGAYKVDSYLKSVFGHRLNVYRNRFKERKALELRTNGEVCRWYYNGIKPNIVWNKLIKLSFVKSNRLYFKEGIVYEDLLWCFNLMRCLTHMYFIPDITYLYHRNQFSIRARTKSEEKNKCHEYIFKEMTNRLVSGERLEETVRWAYLLGSLYIDGYDRPEFQRLYNIYHQELANGRQRSALFRLSMIHCLAKNKVGHLFLKLYMKINYFIQLSKDSSIEITGLSQ